MPLEEAVRKSTSAVAERFGIKRRGYLKPGYFADITVFDEDALKKAVPDQSRSFGISKVFINGKLVLENNTLHTEAFRTSGRALQQSVSSRNFRFSRESSSSSGTMRTSVCRAVSRIASSYPVSAAKGENCAARSCIDIRGRVRLPSYGRSMMSAYIPHAVFPGIRSGIQCPVGEMLHTFSAVMLIFLSFIRTWAVVFVRT